KEVSIQPRLASRRRRSDEREAARGEEAFGEPGPRHGKWIYGKTSGGSHVGRIARRAARPAHATHPSVGVGRYRSAFTKAVNVCGSRNRRRPRHPPRGRSGARSTAGGG